MVNNLLTFRRDPLGTGVNVSITPDSIVGKMFVEQTSTPIARQEPIQRRATTAEEVIVKGVPRFSNAAFTGLRRLF